MYNLFVYYFDVFLVGVQRFQTRQKLGAQNDQVVSYGVTQGNRIPQYSCKCGRKNEFVPFETGAPSLVLPS